MNKKNFDTKFIFLSNVIFEHFVSDKISIINHIHQSLHTDTDL